VLARIKQVSFDLDGRIDTLQSGAVQHLRYGYNVLDQLTGLTDLIDANHDQTLGYDVLDRLDSASGHYGALSYRYDGIGNRQSQTHTGGTDSYSYDPQSHRLLNVTGPNATSRAYDNAGNTTQYDALTLNYGDHNRLNRIQQASTTLASYTHNGQGQRVIKDAQGQVTVFHYDQAGQLLAETEATGNVLREYVYLNGQALALLQAGPSSATYALHPDHLGTVRIITDANQTPVWRWDSAPFGKTLPDEDPDGNGQVLTFNLRFPGQYFDPETGLHYNYFRDYDPQTGRYVQSDPIGLTGGINTYGYVGGNPLHYSDLY